jgi:hypothetical protein
MPIQFCFIETRSVINIKTNVKIHEVLKRMLSGYRQWGTISNYRSMDGNGFFMMRAVMKGFEFNNTSIHYKKRIL